MASRQPTALRGGAVRLGEQRAGVDERSRPGRVREQLGGEPARKRAVCERRARRRAVRPPRRLRRRARRRAGCDRRGGKREHEPAVAPAHLAEKPTSGMPTIHAAGWPASAHESALARRSAGTHSAAATVDVVVSTATATPTGTWRRGEDGERRRGGRRHRRERQQHAGGEHQPPQPRPPCCPRHDQRRQRGREACHAPQLTCRTDGHLQVGCGLRQHRRHHDQRRLRREHARQERQVVGSLPHRGRSKSPGRSAQGSVPVKPPFTARVVCARAHAAGHPRGRRQPRGPPVHGSARDAARRGALRRRDDTRRGGRRAARGSTTRACARTRRCSARTSRRGRGRARSSPAYEAVLDRHRRASACAQRRAQADAPRARASTRSSPTRTSSSSSTRPPRSATSSASTWRSRRASTRRCASTAACAQAGHDNVGTVLQAYLYRTRDDLESLLPLRAEPPPRQGRLPRAAERRLPATRRTSTRPTSGCSSATLTAARYIGDRDARRAR